MPRTNKLNNDISVDQNKIRTADEFWQARIIIAEWLNKHQTFDGAQIAGLAGLSDALRWACGETDTNLSELINGKQLRRTHELN